MGIHGDKSQQERDWVLNGKYLSAGSHAHPIDLEYRYTDGCICALFCRIQTWKGSYSDCYRCGLQRARLVQTRIHGLVSQKIPI